MDEQLNVSAPSTESVGESQGYSEPTPEPSGTPEPAPYASNGGESTFAIRVDPRTGRKQIVSVGGGVEEAEPAYPEMANPSGMQINIPQGFNQQQQQQPLPNYTNAKEIIDAMNSGKLDESRIPVEMAFEYERFKQQVSEQQKINQQQDFEAQQPQQGITQEQAQARQEFFGRVDEMARANALKDIGLSEDELITAEYSDDPEIQAKAQMFETALSMHRNNIIQSVQAERQKQVNAELAQRAVVTNLNAKFKEFAQTDPQYQPIMQMATTYFKDKSIPFDDGVRYLLAMNAYNQGNLTEQQARDVEEYITRVRTAHYAKINGIGVPRMRSPFVENSANSSNMQGGMDRQTLLKQLRSATDYRTKRQLMGQLLGKR